jgi:hypothetical protein
MIGHMAAISANVHAQSYSIDQTRYFATPQLESVDLKQRLEEAAAFTPVDPNNPAALGAYLHRAESLLAQLERHHAYLHLRASSSAGHNFHRQVPFAIERIGDQAAGFRLLQQLFRPFDIGAPRNVQYGVGVESREAHLALDTIQRSFGARFEALPRILRRRCDCSKAQDEAVGDGCGQQAFGRPLVAGTIELLGR